MNFRGFHAFLDGRKLHRFATRILGVRDLLKRLAGGRVVRNLEEDHQIGDDLRLSLLKRLCRPRPDDVGEAGDRFVHFCYGHQRLGKPVENSHIRAFGHVQSRARLENALADDPKAAPVASTPAAFLSALLHVSVERQKERLGDLALHEHQMFSTYNQCVPVAPFHGVECTRAELRRRLGLGQLSPVEPILFWSHRLPVGRRAYVPTVFDGELNPWFRPGGFTLPLTGADGLPEAVHKAVEATQLETPIQQAA